PLFLRAAVLDRGGGLAVVWAVQTGLKFNLRGARWSVADATLKPTNTLATLATGGSSKNHHLAAARSREVALVYETQSGVNQEIKCRLGPFDNLPGTSEFQVNKPGGPTENVSPFVVQAGGPTERLVFFYFVKNHPTPSKAGWWYRRYLPGSGWDP